MDVISIYIIFFLIIIGVVIIPILQYKHKVDEYNKTTYHAITHLSYSEMANDKGRRGEYTIYCHLKHYEEQGFKFLFNVYLPKDNGTTTEIDVLMIGWNGIYVFESKNYQGWIFGNDRQKYWTTTRSAGYRNSRKYKFYNPVWQNKTHCHVLGNYLPYDFPIYSLILFADSCEFKNVNISEKNMLLAHYADTEMIVGECLKNLPPYDISIEQIYTVLYPFSQVSDDVKQSHIDAIAARER